MSLKYAILSVVYRENITGYDLLKRFDGTIGFFWKTTYPQIYRELDTLEKEKWVLGKVEKQSARPDKKIFSITPLGTEMLKKWCSEEINFKPESNEFLLKIFSGELIGGEVVKKHMDDYIKFAHEQITQLNEIKKNYFADEAQSLKGKQAYNYISLLIGINTYESEVKMYRSLQEKIGEIPD